MNQELNRTDHRGRNASTTQSIRRHERAWLLPSVSIALLTAACGTADPDARTHDPTDPDEIGGQVAPKRPATLTQVAQLPGSYAYANRLVSADGQPLATGETPQAAASNFVAAFSSAAQLRDGELELDPDVPPRQLMPDRQTGQAKFTLFTYRQQRGGVPVHGAQMRIMVRNLEKAVEWVSVSLRDLGDFEPSNGTLPQWSWEKTKSAMLQRDPDLTGLDADSFAGKFTSPTPVIYAGSDTPSAGLKAAGIEGTGDKVIRAGIEGTGDKVIRAGIDGSGDKFIRAGIEGTGGKMIRAGVEGTGDRLRAAGIEGTGAPLRFGIEGTGDRVRLGMRYQSLDKGWTFVADAKTGEVLRVKKKTHHYVDGHVRGQHLSISGTPDCAFATSPKILPHAEVLLTGENGSNSQTLTDVGGNYRFDQHAPSGTVSVAATGRYFELEDLHGSPAQNGLVYSTQSFGQNSTLNFTLLGPDDLPRDDFDPSSEAMRRLEQTTVYYALNWARDWVKARAPQFPNVDDPVSVTLGSSNSECFNGKIGLANPGRIEICPKLQGIPQGVYLDVNGGATLDVAIHEYGHVLLFSGAPHLEESGADDSTLHEGIADIFAALMTGIPQRGHGLVREVSAGPISITYEKCEEMRSVSNACVMDETPGSCSEGDASCPCQNALSGAFWDILSALHQSGTSNQNDIVSDLLLSYMQLNHISGAVDSTIPLDLLMLDDDDGNLDNGTPHSDAICQGFEAHGFECPEMADHVCQSYCGGQATGLGCWCDAACEHFGDCCSPTGNSRGAHYGDEVSLVCGF